MDEESELLFFDTFSHETCEELNLDLVQFPCPVYIFEIRVIPLGARVQADFPGGHRLGATNPSSFKLEFFVNDLGQTRACTFERLGSLDYKQNVEIQFPVSNKILTDGLVLKGQYITVTLAVYGVLTKANCKDRSPPPPPPPTVQSRPHPVAVVTDHRSKNFDHPPLEPSEWDRHSRQLEAPPEPPPHHPQAIIESPRFAEVPPVIHPQQDPHVPYAPEIPQPVYSEQPPSIPYGECITATVPSVPSSVQYQQYNTRYTKPWPPPKEHFSGPPTDSYDQQMYTHTPDTGTYRAPVGMWDTKDSAAEAPRPEHDSYDQSFHDQHRTKGSKDRRDKPWDRDSSSTDYKDDDLLRDRDYKKRDRLSWERGLPESDRYRDRDRIKDSSSRDRSHELRDKSRCTHDNFADRGSTKISKRPATPPTHPPHSHAPHTPPEVVDKVGGPRTPKEDDPNDTYPDRGDYYNPITTTDHRPPEPHYNLSEGEIQEGENTEDDDGYEEIVSEEGSMSDEQTCMEERVLDIVDVDYDMGDDTWNYMSSFDPYRCELTQYNHFKDPTLSKFEILEKRENKETASETVDSVLKENKILEMIEMFQGKEHQEKWVEALESFDSSAIESLLDSGQEYENAVETLIQWVNEGLNFDMAMQQPGTPYKVRHLKAGIRVAAFLFNTNETIINKLLDCEVPKLLLQLFEQPFMVLPVKLLILRALDSALKTKQGYEFILKKPVEFLLPRMFDGSIKTEVVDNPVKKTVYQKLLEILISKQSTRAVVSTSALMEKLHLYEVLQSLQEAVEYVSKSLIAIEQKSIPDEPTANLDPSVEPMDTDVLAETSNLSSLDEHLQIIITCLIKIISSYQTAWKKMAHPKRYLPATTQFEFPKSPFDPYPNLLRMFKENGLLENILTIVSLPSLVTHPGLMVAIRDLLTEFLGTQNGMLFLLSKPDVLNDIQKTLLQTEETREEGNEETIPQCLGMHLVYHLQSLLYVDLLFSYHAHSTGTQKRTFDDPNIVSVLHDMYTIIFNPIGRIAVVHVLSTENNLDSLLPFVQATGEEDVDLKLSKSVCSGYATELLMLTVQCSESSTFIEKYSEILFNIGQQEVTPKFHDLVLWMGPARKITASTHEAISHFTGILKSHLEDAATLPPELITSLRILKHICLPPDDERKDMVYMYNMIHMFANDGLSYSLTILQSISNTFLKPSHQSLALVGMQGVFVIAIAKPIIFMIKNMLSYLIPCRKSEFKDLTAVPVLLEVYSLMMLVPSTSFSFHLSQEVQKEIIAALLIYTQPCLRPLESEEALSKGLWTQMLNELLKYCQQSPRSFIASFTILSELLPLPLPLPTQEPLSLEEVEKVINHRKLWSAHLHCLSGTIQQVILSLSGTTCNPLQQLLRRVCIQLCDLASPTALIVVRAVLDAFLETVEPEVKESVESTGRTSSPTLPAAPSDCSSATARSLNLIAYLVSHTAFKIPLMQVLRGINKVDEKYAEVLGLLLNTLNVQSKKPSHIHSQECILAIILSFCDPDVSFIAIENGATVNEVLASCLPPKEQMLQICSSLIHHIGNTENLYSSVLSALRSLVMLMEHDYGFFHVKQSLEQNPAALRSLFSRLSLMFSKDNSDYLSVLSTALEFLRLMVNGYDEGAQTGRSMLLPLSELAAFFSMQSRKVKEKHEDLKCKEDTFKHLSELEKRLLECASEEEAVESLLESVSSLILLLNEGAEKEDKNDNKDIKEPVLPEPESLAVQFTSRPTFLVGEVDEERLSPAYWLSMPLSDDIDQDQDQIAVDLLSISEKYISGEFCLKSSLESLCTSVNNNAELKTKEKGMGFSGKRKYQSGNLDGSSKRAFIAPMRGRGFSRATSHSSRANDPFRSRPPNTSRPPSMHVDDFVALESHHNDGNTQVQPKRQDGLRGRGRGFDRGQPFSSTRGVSGRFFSPPGPYGRRDVTTRVSTRGSVRLSNSACGGRSSTIVPKSTAGQIVRSNFSRPSTSDRCGYGVQFSSEPRLGTQRSARDSYQDLSLSPSTTLSRFSRVGRVENMGPPVQGHWQETRNKAQNQQFMSGSSPSRGSGRRELNGRHNRSFTR